MSTLPFGGCKEPGCFIRKREGDDARYSDRIAHRDIEIHDAVKVTTYTLECDRGHVWHVTASVAVKETA